MLLVQIVHCTIESTKNDISRESTEYGLVVKTREEA